MKFHKIRSHEAESGDVTLEDHAEPGLLEELLEYLQAISNPVRLEIITFIERGPKSVREIANHINSNYDNTKKHIDRLLNAGIIRKEPGIGKETSRGALPVWKYSLMYGGIESIIRNLNSFSNLDLKIISDKAMEAIEILNENLSGSAGNEPYLQILGGDDDKKVFPVISPVTKIGRTTGNRIFEEDKCSVILSGSYLSVTRISGVHAEIQRHGTQYIFSDPGSTNGSYINYKPVIKGESIILSDGDIIDLGRGQTRARLIFHMD
ncbi:transcriptional regulator, ArsR family [Methanolacinia petrolearia DSM 11571]|uniref:Transcriptional regulator, ArsR family n=1 Tax=Methanolacinia petrolearia (strain DSM 11571 / OCM 486 / SEBR 4847) TaxID=679926 RepID=E1REC0_METP4|nr:FHA domain-containing protein [Methanolacinia petrolearia]ADN36083.1 transcriptional regulator, ArsR family [Methanolacinia petrolearia DSM 11571]